MIDPNDKELRAIDSGGEMGGEYLESIGKFDMSKLSAIEWHQFLRCVVGGYTESLQTQEAEQVNLDTANKK